jgi:hypothetical protein
MFTCRCGCDSTNHGKLGCMTCGCMHYELHRHAVDAEVSIFKGRIANDVLVATRESEDADAEDVGIPLYWLRS